MFEPNDLESLLLDDHFLGLALAEDGEDSGPRALARWVADIEAGRAQLPPGWSLSREAAGAVIWVAPSGERYRAGLPSLMSPPAQPRVRPLPWLEPDEEDYYSRDYLDEDEEEEYEDETDSGEGETVQPRH